MLQRCLPGALVLVLAGAMPAAARQAPAAPPPAQQPEQKPEQVPAPDESPVYKEQVVVTASKTEQALVNAPATVSLITSETLQNNASTSYADLFRAVPGLNVTQTSARDINITSRGATSTLSTSQLALVDGRSIYLDFFGFIAWDFLPVNPAEIKQIEVIRGPASAIWGANAMNGVVNVITKTPRELQGTSVTMGVGAFGREVAGARARTPARSSTSTDRTRRSSTIAGPTRCRRASTRRTRWRGRPAICPSGHAVSGLHQRRARRSRSSTCGSTTTSRTASASWCSRAAWPAPTASCTAASGRSTSTRAPSSATAR